MTNILRYRIAKIWERANAASPDDKNLKHTYYAQVQRHIDAIERRWVMQFNRNSKTFRPDGSRRG